jgi:uncharacterized protein YhhL (DUF1145 family)
LDREASLGKRATPRLPVIVRHTTRGHHPIMNTLLKGGCLAVYLLALVGLFADLPFGCTHIVQYLAVILLGAHALEILVAYKSVKRYPGPLAVSMVLTLLFGFLHWLPLAGGNARATE